MTDLKRLEAEMQEKFYRLSKGAEGRERDEWTGKEGLQTPKMAFPPRTIDYPSEVGSISSQSLPLDKLEQIEL